MFSSESENEEIATGHSIFTKSIDLDTELKNAIVPKPVIKPIKVHKPASHFLISTANKRAEQDALKLSKQLESIQKDESYTPLYRAPEVVTIKPVKLKISREKAISEYKERSLKRKRLNDEL